MNRRKKYSWAAFALLALGLVAMIFPFVWMLLSAFKNKGDVYTYPPRWLPSSLNWDNFSRVFTMVPFARWFLNSLLVSALMTLFQVGLAILAAFAFAKMRFPLKGAVYLVVISTMLLPQIVTIVPMFLLIAKLGLVDTYAGLILPELFSGFTVLLLQQYFLAVPDDLMHAARIDGCGPMGCLRHVVIPNSGAAIATASFFSFLAHWRSYLWPLIVVNSSKLRTLPIGLRYLVTESASDYQVMMAASVMAILPVLVAFAFTEKKFIRSITLSGLKA
jgi:multiple sugar transport system permease protein